MQLIHNHLQQPGWEEGVALGVEGEAGLASLRLLCMHWMLQSVEKHNHTE